MHIILAARNKIHYEQKRSGDILVVYVPGQDAPIIHRGLQNKTVAEVKSQYSDNNVKPLIREVDGEVGIFGSLDQDLIQRRRPMRVYLPQDFLPANTQAYYILFGDKHIVHGHNTVNDEGKEHWGSSVITLQGGDPLKIIRSAISERMLDGAADSICVAVEADLNLYKELGQELKAFGINPVPFSELKKNVKNIPTLYQHKDYSLLMLLIMFLLGLACLAVGFFWWTNKNMIVELEQKIVSERRQIKEIQSNTKLGYIIKPQAILSQMEVGVTRPPSSYLNSGAQIVKTFGKIEDIVVDLSQPVFINTLNGDSNIKSILMTAKINQGVKMLLIDQERIARQLVEQNKWIQKIENNSFGNSDMVLNLQLNVENIAHD